LLPSAGIKGFAALRALETGTSVSARRPSTGKGNVLNIGERIRTLGAKTKTPMPAVNVGGELFSQPIHNQGWPVWPRHFE
jgi:hypothetical protein